MSRWLLPVEDVGLVEGDVVAKRGERLQQAAIIGGGAVPVRRQQARPVEGDVHSAASRAEAPRPARRGTAATIASSSSTRCAQVWRWRMVSQAARRERAARGPDRAAAVASCAAIASPSRAIRKSSRPEQPLLVLPGRADQRNAARQRLEHADRGDAGKRRDIGPPRHVDGHAVAANTCRHVDIGDPAAVAQAGARQRGAAPASGIAHAAHRAAQIAAAVPARSGTRASSCARSPSPQLPIHTRSSGCCAARRGKNSRVSAASCQVNTCAAPAALEIALAAARRRTPAPRRSPATRRSAIAAASESGAVMRVVEQQGEPAALPPDACRGARSARDRSIHARAPRPHRRRRAAWSKSGVVGTDGTARESRGGTASSAAAPWSASRFARLQPSSGSSASVVMAARLQFAQHAAQEMRVAVVPVGHQRVGVEDEPHAASPAAHGRACAASAAA